MNLRDYKTIKERRDVVEKTCGLTLKNIATFSLDEQQASTRNCENMIGVTQVPLGIAGPLSLQDSELEVNNYYIPLATTEGALVASVNRGCKAITESGGAMVDCHRVGTTRGPVFKVENIRENSKLYTFLQTNIEEIKRIVETTSSHLTLKKISSKGVGKYRFMRFVYDTQDAMGMNMVTIATQKAIEFITAQTGAHCVAVAGNYDIDKKAAWLNIIENRGTKVWAEVTIPANILEKTLKTTAQDMYDVWLAKCMIGSAMAGSLGFNAHFANVVAAIFLATGQDIAHVTEGSLGITTTEVINGKDLYISVYLPDLMVGTVGGGTGLATQKEAMAITGVKDAKEFAMVVGGAVLAGELSLLASLAENSLASSHQKLARGGK